MSQSSSSDHWLWEQQDWRHQCVGALLFCRRCSFWHLISLKELGLSSWRQGCQISGCAGWDDGASLLLMAWWVCDLSPPLWWLVFSSYCFLTVRHGCREGREDRGWREAGEGMYDSSMWLYRQQQSHSTSSSNVFPSQEYGVPFMETSAKTGVNVELAFLAIAR